MNYIIESILVGVYSSTIYLLFSRFIEKFSVLLLVCGFFKHFLGSSFEIWTWYCNNGEACVNVLSQDQIYEANTQYLIQDSFYESFFYLITGTILTMIIPLNNRFVLFFMIGFILHIIAEHTGVHKIFCKKTCDKITE